MNVKSPVGRVSFPDVFEASQVMGEGAFKFRITLLVERDAPGLEELKAEVDRVTRAKWPDGVPKNFFDPIIDGDTLDRDECKGKIVLRFSAREDRRPQVLDRDMTAIVKSDNKFYAGCYAHVVTSVYAWSRAGKNGVSLGLEAVQKVRDGESLVGRSDPTALFSVVE